MKKNLLILLFASFALITGYNASSSKQNVTIFDVTMENIETLSACEITKGDKVKLVCSGEGTCSKKYLGYTLTCDGTEVK